MATVGLSMIVKNETAVITRALDSVRPLVDYVLVVDTGSTDGTQQFVNDWLTLNQVAGKVIEVPWRDFAYNRSYALAALRRIKDIDYALVLDADDALVIEADPATFKPKLTSDAYAIPIRHGNIVHRRVQLCSNHKPFHFRGVVHEFLHCNEPFTQAPLDDVSIRILGGGVRARDGSTNVYLRDAALLEQALANGADIDLKPRYTFYLAQSWRDAREPQKAFDTYLERVKIGGWIEETYVALLNAARLAPRLEFGFHKTLELWKRAIAIVPKRAEAYHGAAALCRGVGCNHEALDYARRGLGLAQPEGLFIEPWIYEYGLLDEYAVASYYCDLFAESLIANCVLLALEQIDPATRNRVQKNAEFAKAKCNAR